MSDPAHPHELPAAYMPPAYIAPPSAVDQPALGLVLAFGALFSLPQPAMMLVQALHYESLMSRIGGITLLMIVELLLQLAAGLAVAWQWRARRLVGLAYLACAAAVIVAGIALMKSDGIGLRYGAVMVLEGVGSPLLVLCAPRWFGMTKVTRATALGGLLLIGGVNTWISISVSSINQLKWMLDAQTSLGAWFGEALRVAIALVTGTLSLVAGLRLVRGQPARRAIAIYVIVAIGTHLAMTALSLIWLAVDGGRFIGIVVANTAVSTALGIATPTVIWLFAKRETESTADVSAALPWIALWFVPQLVARGLMIEELQMLLANLAVPIAVLCGACAIANLGAARAALRGDSARTWWTVAAGLAVALFATTFYAVQSLDGSRIGMSVTASASVALWPAGLLVATTATAAWLGRRLTSAR